MKKSIADLIVGWNEEIKEERFGKVCFWSYFLEQIIFS